jgi:uncharacterized protein (DUF1330 family)
MKLNGSIVVALLAGPTIGAVVTGARAQITPAAYAVIDVSEITDPVGYAALIADAPAGLVPFGGRYVIRSDRITILSGPARKLFVVIAFDSLERAQRWSELGLPQGACRNARQGREVALVDRRRGASPNAESLVAALGAARFQQPARGY